MVTVSYLLASFRNVHKRPIKRRKTLFAVLDLNVGGVATLADALTLPGSAPAQLRPVCQG